MTYPFFCTELEQQLMDGLTRIEKETTPTLRQASAAVVFTKNLVKELDRLAGGDGFVDRQEAIFFYKDIRPKFVSYCLYYERLYQLELDRPSADPELEWSYLEQERQRLRGLMAEHRFLQRYMRSGETSLDEALFLNPPPEGRGYVQLYSAVNEAGGGVYYGDVVAQLLAAGLLFDYLNTAGELIKPSLRDMGYRRALTWTDSKAGLIELGYALHAAGVVNGGKAELKEIMEALEWVFQVSLRNHPRTFQEILARKSGYTVLIDRLKGQLLLRIQQIEERHIR